MKKNNVPLSRVLDNASFLQTREQKNAIKQPNR
jgi:hypothetical protein